MEKKEKPAGEGRRESSESGGDGRSWSRVVQGQPRVPAWTSHKISKEEIDDLQRYFSSVLELPEGVMEDSRRQWENLSVFVRSLGRRVPLDWVVKEVRLKSKLDYDPEGFSLAEEHFLLRFRSSEDCAAALRGGPWFVAGQLLALEPWEPDFVPGRRLITKSVVWLRLPALPLEFWVSPVILAIAAEAGRPLATDGFTDMLRKTGFARIRVEIDAGKPLKPGVLVKGKRGNFWQPFVYENLPSVCFRCGRLGHSDEGCRYFEGVLPSDASGAPPPSEQPVSVVGQGGTPMAVEGEAASVPGASDSGRPRLGPWLVTSRIRQPRGPRVPVRARKEVVSNPDSSEPNSSSSRPDSPRPRPSPPTSPPHSDGWQKPTKVARRRSPAERVAEASGGRVNSAELDLGSESGFRVLGPLGDRMELGLPEMPGPVDLLMLDAGSSSLKRPRSPPGLVKPLATSASDKVGSPSSDPCADPVGRVPCVASAASSGGKGRGPDALVSPGSLLPEPQSGSAPTLVRSSTLSLEGDIASEVKAVGPGCAGLDSPPAMGSAGEGSLTAFGRVKGLEAEGRLVGRMDRPAVGLESSVEEQRRILPASWLIAEARSKGASGVDGVDRPKESLGGVVRPEASLGQVSALSTEGGRRSSGEPFQFRALSGGAATASEGRIREGGEGVLAEPRLGHVEATGRLKAALMAVEVAEELNYEAEKEGGLAGKPAQSPEFEQ